ncbi:3'-5' exonuclease [Vibrio sp. JC009]|uniref:3'-5' exonuclease n=1 Tax=Vibrio sp. JC009 TaxID=2912314 RepID=UPI0023AEC4B4|nr:3'-5' exonuclease [Vibrio sp. JC009]WED20571.1 3'-5' exonuclease [Vibrio sp. JC009]
MFFKKSNNCNWPEYYHQAPSRVKDQRLLSFFEQGIFSPETPLSQIRFVALDFETTGLDPDKDDIISIGLVPFTLNRIYLNQAKHWIVSPSQPLEEESVIIHGITHSDIVDAPDLTRILEQVLESLAGHVVVAHFRKIERNFLDKALKERIGEGMLFPIVDTMEVEAEIQKKRTQGIVNRLKGTRPLSVRLAKSRARYGLPVYSAHHALTDAIATAELLQAQISHHYSDMDPISKFWK